jgi:hypothetical protein
MRGWASWYAPQPKKPRKRPYGRSSAHWRSTRALRMPGSELQGFFLGAWPVYEQPFVSRRCSATRCGAS